MSYLPPSTLSSMSPPYQGASSSNAAPKQPSPSSTLEQLVRDLSNVQLRENALFQLSQRKDLFVSLAPLLWNTVGTITGLLEEVISVYPFLNPPNLTHVQSNRACNAIGLLKCVASDAETRMSFLKAQLPMYLYAFVNTTDDSRPFEYLRLTSLGVFGALVKDDDPEVVKYLLQNEIVPLCLRTMDNGSVLAKTVSTYVIQRILTHDVGLQYMCINAERFFAVGKVLGKMVISLAEQHFPTSPTSRLLKLIIRCYLRLTDHPRACDALGTCLPDVLKDSTFNLYLYDDTPAKQCLSKLLHNVKVGGKLPDGFDPYSVVM